MTQWTQRTPQVGLVCHRIGATAEAASSVLALSLAPVINPVCVVQDALTFNVANVLMTRKVDLQLSRVVLHSTSYNSSSGRVRQGTRGGQQRRQQHCCTTQVAGEPAAPRGRYLATSLPGRKPVEPHGAHGDCGKRCCGISHGSSPAASPVPTPWRQHCLTAGGPGSRGFSCYGCGRAPGPTAASYALFRPGLQPPPVTPRSAVMRWRSCNSTTVSPCAHSNPARGLSGQSGRGCCQGPQASMEPRGYRGRPVVAA